MTTPLVAARRPVRRLVFLCALIAAPGASLVDQVRTERDIFVPGFRAGLAPPDGQRRSLWVDYAIARETLYQDCAEEHAAAAFERLRPQSSAPDAEPCPLAALPAVPATSVVAAEDRIVNPEWSRRAARERLGIEPVELPGGHSPFLSRPGTLAELLDAQAARSA